MRVLITGASGLIGSAVSDLLLARGDEVVGLTRDPVEARSTNPTVSWHEWQPAAERPPDAALEGVDAVVNLVGEVLNQRWTQEAKRRIIDSRVRSTKNLIDALTALSAQERPAVLVQASAVGYYGDRGDAVIDESAPPGTDFVADVCEEWETAAAPATEAGIRLAIVRSGPVFTPKFGMLKELLPFFKLGVGGPLAGGDQYVPWIHLDDEARLILWAIDNPSVEGPINAVAPTPVTNRELTKSLARTLRRPAFVPVPRFAISALRGRDVADMALVSQRAIPRRAQDLGFEFRHPDLDEALADLLAGS